MTDVSRWTLAIVTVAAMGCEQGRDGLQHVQRAVGRGAQAALAARPTAMPEDNTAEAQAIPEARADEAPVGAVPEPVNVDGTLRFVPDGNHRDVSGVRTRDGYAVTWTDGARHGVYVGMLDASGHAHAAGTLLHTTVDDEEALASPAVVAAGDGYGVAWTDRDNGRVRFARLDARGALRGRVSIVHDGVASPRATRLAWNGREFAVAVELREGVYFARVAADGTRIGEALVFAEGAPVASVDSVEWDGRGYAVSYTVRSEAGTARLRQRVGIRADRRDAVLLGGVG